MMYLESKATIKHVFPKDRIQYYNTILAVSER
jgi:hypothetical protein